MKKTRQRSLRGSAIADGGRIKQRLILSDGLLNHGLKIKSFTMWTTSGSNAAGIDATLSCDVIPSGMETFDASDNRQIAWVCGGYDNGIMTQEYRSIIDPDHVINRDLFLTADATDGLLWNWLIICDAFHLTDDEAIISIIKETSQNI